MDFSYLDDWTEEEGGEAVVEEGGEGYRNIWVVAEAAAGDFLPATLETMGQARELADQIGVYVFGVLLGDGVEALAENLVPYGADKVLVADDPALAQYQAETYSQALAELIDRYRPEILLLPGTPLGNDLAPRLAQRLNTGLISHCIKLSMDMSERLLLGTFAVMGGEVYHTVACPQARPQMATLEPGYFRTPYKDDYRSGDVQVVDVDLDGASGRLDWIDPDAEVQLPATKLSKARVVVAAGRGMGDAEGFALVQRLARALQPKGAGADGSVKIAGTRGAFDKGWIEEDQIVGVAGAAVAPDLYVACGVSGDVYHHFGLQDAKFVVAINTDPKAPILKMANMAVIGDAREIIPAMLEALEG
jgi:electron transfer flavoprotein alpha subunit